MDKSGDVLGRTNFRLTTMERYNDDLYSTFRLYRKALNEAENGKNDNPDDGVPYTMQDELMQSITQTCKQQFGADFSKSDSPMIYYPNDGGGNVILSGIIGSMDNAKFHFKYKGNDGGCFVWTNPVILNDENLRTLNVIYGVYKNWKKELGECEDIKPMSMKNDNGGEDYVPSIPNGQV